jgi:hypothetical protein
MDEGPARRLPLGGDPPAVLPAPTLEEGKTADAPLAQHGFSALVPCASVGTTFVL